MIFVLFFSRFLVSFWDLLFGIVRFHSGCPSFTFLFCFPLIRDSLFHLKRSQIAFTIASHALMLYAANQRNTIRETVPLSVCRDWRFNSKRYHQFHQNKSIRMWMYYQFDCILFRSIENVNESAEIGWLEYCKFGIFCSNFFFAHRFPAENCDTKLLLLLLLLLCRTIIICENKLTIRSRSRWECIQSINAIHYICLSMLCSSM